MARAAVRRRRPPAEWIGARAPGRDRPNACDRPASSRQRPRGGAQPRLARRPVRPGRSSSTTTSSRDRAGGPIWPATSRRMERLEGGSQGRIVVPRPPGRAPTDWERNVGGLARARWATADMAYRRTALERVGGFDERFPRAYREDADLALRVREAGFDCVPASARWSIPCVGPRGGRASAPRSGNADDMLMRRVHGRRWRQLAEAGRGVDPPACAHDGSRHASPSPRCSPADRAGRLVAGVAGGDVAGPCDILLRPPDPSGAANGCRDRGDGRDQPGHPARRDVAPRARLAARAAAWCRDDGRPLCSSTVTAR